MKSLLNNKPSHNGGRDGHLMTLASPCISAPRACGKSAKSQSCLGSRRLGARSSCCNRRTTGQRNQPQASEDLKEFSVLRHSLTLQSSFKGLWEVLERRPGWQVTRMCHAGLATKAQVAGALWVMAQYVLHRGLQTASC